jgi:predicted secreted protein
VLNVLFVLVQVRRVQIGVDIVFVSWYKVIVRNVNIVNIHRNIRFRQEIRIAFQTGAAGFQNAFGTKRGVAFGTNDLGFVHIIKTGAARMTNALCAPRFAYCVQIQIHDDPKLFFTKAPVIPNCTRGVKKIIPENYPIAFCKNQYTMRTSLGCMGGEGIFMGFMSQVIVFVLVWWIVFFMMLPWRYTPNTQRQAGQDPGAPQQAFIAKKMLITTLITLPLWFGAVSYLKTVNFADPASLGQVDPTFCKTPPCP